MLPSGAADDIRRSPALFADLAALADCGGRFAGSPSEARARRWLVERLQGMPSVVVREHPFPYEGWRRREAQLRLLAPSPRPLACHSLVWSRDTPAAGLEAEVVDVGRGAPADFDRVKAALAGRIALVEHEYPFAAGTIHRRVKYTRACDEGCVGFIIANNLADGGLVTGSSGQGTWQDVPAVGVSYASGRLLAGGAAQRARVRLDVKSERFAGQGANIVADLPGQAAETVIVCAHYDGHDLAESALDNATGLAAALRVLETLAPHAAAFRRNLRVVFFTNEEWRLFGSQQYVDALAEEELRRIALVVNLDTLAGSSRLACLTSGFEEISAFVTQVAAALGREIAIVPRLLGNSDHFNFARRGVPAMRLIAGFEEPGARARYLLTEGDTRDKVETDEFRAATLATAAIVWRALTHQGSMPRHKTSEEMRLL
jgi:hypothetical protein